MNPDHNDEISTKRASNSNIVEPKKISDDSSNKIEVKTVNQINKDDTIPKKDVDAKENIKETYTQDTIKNTSQDVPQDEEIDTNKDKNDEKENTEETSFQDIVTNTSQAYPQEDEENDTNKDTNELSTDEEVGEFEDVILPEEEEVEEIIVPDEAEAEDLTDDREEDNNHTVRVQQEVETSKDSEVEENEINTSLHEEESIKSSRSEIYENEDKSDKASIYEDQQDETSNNSDDEDELVALEDGEKEALLSRLNDNSNDGQNHNADSDKNSIYDPLNCVEEEEEDNETYKNNTQDSLESKTNEQDDDDDEVQFIETRNSPICIDSEEDDKIENIKLKENLNNTEKIACATVAESESIIVKRTSARKSTSKPQQQQQNYSNVKKSPSTVPQLQKKCKKFSYLQAATNRFTCISSAQKIVDCIDLLDSSDEELTSSSHYKSNQQMQVKTPQKRTLLAAKGNYYKCSNKNTANENNFVPNNLPYTIRQQAKKPAPPPLPPPTPQSNFLNAVQLQPAAVSGINPPAFSALLSNKNVIIPNAFYGNPPSVRGTPETDMDRRYIRWLENFLNQFCKSQFVPTHSCYVFLQRALKYKDFVRIKTLRSNMNIHDPRDHMNNQLMADLRTILLKNTKQISSYGRRFCELTCSTVQGKALSLITHSITGKVTLKTCNMEIPKIPSTISSATSSSNLNSNSLTRKRQVDEDEDEYTPDKSKPRSKAKTPSENGDRDSGENSEDRKRSLRTKRTKRLDNSFSYNEDDLLAEYEIEDEEEAEKLAQAEIQRKIEEKRLEAQKQRQQQVKSFESAFIQAFAKSIDGPTSSLTATNLTNHRLRLKNSAIATSSSIRDYTANNDTENLLQATWIENLENDDTQIISDDDEPREHRIYKQQHQLHIQPEQQHNYQYSTKTTKKADVVNPSPRFQTRHQDESITGDNQYCNDNTNYSVPSYWPKNIDPQMHANGKFKQKCVICNLNCQRLVHHYVNEHRGCEVYNSRITSWQIKLLKQGNISSNVSLYKNGQFQYEAYCVFCEKLSRFMLPYWYQHFTMHTGEYAYRCTGCGIRKPTRSLITQHHAQGCPEDGSVAQDYVHDSKTMQIEAKICTLCNYVQLHRNNIVKHLHQQHGIKQILPKHIQTIVLLKTSVSLGPVAGSTLSISSNNVHTNHNYGRTSTNELDTYVIDDDDDTDNGNEFILNDVTAEETPYNTENHYYNYIPPYMQAAVNSGNFSFESVDAGNDLSFMICGMLDVQMNTE